MAAGNLNVPQGVLNRVAALVTFQSGTLFQITPYLLGEKE